MLQGVGLLRPVVVTRVLLVSKPYSLVSYSLPTVVSASGCADSGNSTTDCPRRGVTWLTVTGANFGAANARVFIGGQVTLSCDSLSASLLNRVVPRSRARTCLTGPRARTRAWCACCPLATLCWRR